MLIFIPCDTSMSSKQTAAMKRRHFVGLNEVEQQVVKNFIIHTKRTPAFHPPSVPLKAVPPPQELQKPLIFHQYDQSQKVTHITD